MASRNKYAQKYLRWHSTYEKRAFKELKKTFRLWIKAIQWDYLTIQNYKAEINNSFNIELMNRAYLNIYKEIGSIHGIRVGRDINLQLKAFTISQFLTLFERNVAQYLQLYGVRRIVTVRETFFEFIIDLIANRLEEEEDMRTVAKEIEKEVNRKDFYNWQARRIARTESTASSNYGAIQAGDVSGFAMVKDWISALDKRTRRHPDEFDHYEMDGVKVDINGKFEFNKGTPSADFLAYPGDPLGQAGNVINCRCTVSIIPKRTKEGRLIPLE